MRQKRDGPAGDHEIVFFPEDVTDVPDTHRIDVEIGILVEQTDSVVNVDSGPAAAGARPAKARAVCRRIAQCRAQVLDDRSVLQFVHEIGLAVR